MLFMTEQEAKLVIGTHAQGIVSSIQMGLSDYFTSPEYARARIIHSQRTASSAAHDHVIHQLTSDFADVSGVSFSNRKNLKLMLIHRNGTLIALRFNKFTRGLLAQGNRTRQSYLYQKLELEGFPKHAPLVAGYRLNKLASTIAGIYITCRYQNQNLWEWNLLETASEQGSLFEFPSVIPNTAVTAARGRVVKLKRVLDNVEGDQN